VRGQPGNPGATGPTGPRGAVGATGPTGPAGSTPAITCSLVVLGPFLQINCKVPPTSTIKHTALLIVRHDKRVVAAVRSRVRDHRIAIRLRTGRRLHGKGKTTVTVSVPVSGAITASTTTES
jgi:hypothetical protein